MIKRFKLGKEALTLSIMTLITILIWVGFDVYRAATKTTIPRVTQHQMRPLNPKLNKKAIENLKTNLFFSEEELNTMPVSLPQPEKSTESSQVATKSGSLE